jgi:hypothetical protein
MLSVLVNVPLFTKELYGFIHRRLRNFHALGNVYAMHNVLRFADG